MQYSLLAKTQANEIMQWVCVCVCVCVCVYVCVCVSFKISKSLYLNYVKGNYSNFIHFNFLPLVCNTNMVDARYVFDSTDKE